MDKSVVIDTNIWIKAIVDDEYEYECNRAIMHFLENPHYNLVLDFENVIYGEYNDNLAGERKFQIWYSMLEKQNRQTWVSGRVSKKRKKDLLSRTFHEEEDQCFVCCAEKTGKILVTEDSDYGVHGEPEKKEAYQYITEQMQVRLFTACEFCEVL